MQAIAASEISGLGLLPVLGQGRATNLPLPPFLWKEATELGKLPAIQFYPGDWRKDVGVQSLAFHDRGVWFEILMLMHESERRGVLTLNGAPMSDDALARLLGLDKQILTTTLSELITTGVASRDPDTGALMCRRMVRDENLRKTRAEAGKKGGNPVLLIQKPTTDLSKNQPLHEDEDEEQSFVFVSNKELTTLLELIVVAHPRSLERQLSASEVSPSQRVAVLNAAKHEAAKSGQSVGVCLEMILQQVQRQANESPPDQYRFFKDIPAYFAEFGYRSEPRKENSNGRKKPTIEQLRQFSGESDAVGDQLPAK